MANLKKTLAEIGRKYGFEPTFHERYSNLWDELLMVMEDASDQGYEEAVQALSIKLLDGTEANKIRKEAAERLREIRAVSKEFKLRAKNEGLV